MTCRSTRPSSGHAAIASAPDTDAQGHAHEDLAVYLFEAVAGCWVERNLMNDFQTEEVDVAVGNDRLPEGLPILPHVVLVECKDWSRSVDSRTLGYFINTLANRSVEVGILIATTGIAGQAVGRHAAALGIGAAARGMKVLVITKDDLVALTSTEDFIEMVSRRYLRAVASGTIGLP